MFTGIVEEVGVVAAVAPFAAGRRIRVSAAHVVDDLAVGESIAVDGVCQTVVARDDAGFVVEAIATTLSRTTLGALAPGDEVNLERAIAAGDRLGGHFVQGHVDGVGTVRAIDARGEHVLLEIDVPDAVAEVTVLHGSIAIQGVSLTVNTLPAPGVVQVALIPHTWARTNLRRLRVGGPVNVEGDLLGRHVVEFLKRRGGSGV